MKLYLCRWENGDFSVVQAESKENAIKMLDEVANGEGLPIYAITDFMVHFRLSDEGTVELEEFGEEFGNHVRERVHPILGKLDVSLYDAGPEDRSRIKTAVGLERNRLKARPAPEPDTELGKRIKTEMDLPTSVINRHIRASATELLRKTRPKGKPN
jgi:hypothetical protein